MPVGPKPTCECGICAKCRRRDCMRRLRREKAALKNPWNKSVRRFTLEHLNYSQSALSAVAMSAQQLLEHSRRLRLRVFEVMPTDGKVC